MPWACSSLMTAEAADDTVQGRREAGEFRKVPHGAKLPFVIRHERAVQQKDGVDRGLREGDRGQLRGAFFAVVEAAEIIVLPGLRHRSEFAGQLFQADVLGPFAQRVAPHAEDAGIILPKDCFRGCGTSRTGKAWLRRLLSLTGKIRSF